MPYKSNKDLPRSVRDALPEPAQTIWRNVANSQLKSKLSESRSIASAWAAVGRIYGKGKKGKWELKKAQTYKPSSEIAANAKRALEVRDDKPDSQKGMTSTGLARANQLINREGLSLNTVQRMYSFFSRHEVDKQGSTWGEKGKGWQAWNGWGGDAGFTWSRNILKREGLIKAELVKDKIEYKTDEDLLKAGESLGLVFAWSMITDKDGKPYHDTDGDHFPEDVMMKSSLNYMMGKRTVNIGHTPKDVGTMVFGFPLTKEIAKHFGIKTDKYGFIGAAKVDDETYKLFQEGKLKGFSVEGSYSAEDL